MRKLCVLLTASCCLLVTPAVADARAKWDAKVLAHIFDPYFTTKRGGTGLGLPITKNIVGGLGGTIGISSTPGAGTEIVVDLPLDSTDSRPA